MKEDIIKKLIAVLNALDSVSVHGKVNLGNLAGSIAMIEEVTGILEGVDITPHKQEQPQ